MAYIIVTGKNYLDIDMIAGVQALYEAMTLEGKEVYVQNVGIYSASVTKDMIKRIVSFPEKEIESTDQLIAVDVSSVDYLETQCGYPINQFSHIFDHHFESTDFWKEKLGDKAVIEEIGAAATLIYEYIQDKELFSDITFDTKILLAAAIVSNSQNFKFSMTTQRDHDAFNHIAQDEGLGDGFAEQYFSAVQDEVSEDVQEALTNDTKTRMALTDKTFGVTQLEMWDTNKFIGSHKKQVISFLEKSDADIAFFISASLSEDATYFITVGDVSKLFLEDLLGITFAENVAVLDKIMLRKEVIKKIVS